MVGEIHLANIYFTDATTAKVRPVLLIKPNSFGDILYLPLTTNLQTSVAFSLTELLNLYFKKYSFNKIIFV